ncbi:hypothetical protein [Actinoplanes subtropicus]|uniref:hypothetical protein n=1 Tax=Actinoplanes subtropicus TaxID=543632 RepID=UPI000ACDB212|nr:hypothetical protein [Actinoplanes subtropicus]
MANNQNRSMDPVENLARKERQAAARLAAMAADSRQRRAAHAAGRDSRAIGVSRKAFGR